jgi:hypothetical protein
MQLGGVLKETLEGGAEAKFVSDVLAGKPAQGLVVLLDGSVRGLDCFSLSHRGHSFARRYRAF